MVMRGGVEHDHVHGLWFEIYSITGFSFQEVLLNNVFFVARTSSSSVE